MKNLASHLHEKFEAMVLSSTPIKVDVYMSLLKYIYLQHH